MPTVNKSIDEIILLTFNVATLTHIASNLICDIEIMRRVSYRNIVSTKLLLLLGFQLEIDLYAVIGHRYLLCLHLAITP